MPPEDGSIESALRKRGRQPAEQRLERGQVDAEGAVDVARCEQLVDPIEMTADNTSLMNRRTTSLFGSVAISPLPP